MAEEVQLNDMNGSSCVGCHWYHPEDPAVQRINLSMENWAPNTLNCCGEYIRTEDYQPTGMWASLAEVVNKVEDLMERKTKASPTTTSPVPGCGF